MTIELVRALPAWLMWLALAGLVSAAYTAGYVEGMAQ
jgi:hypothetical protein